MSNSLYLEFGEASEVNGELILRVPLETVVIICVYKYCKTKDVKVIFVKPKVPSGRDYHFKIRLQDEMVITDRENVPWIAQSCRLPLFLAAENCLTAGLAASARKLAQRTTLSPDPSSSSIHPDGLLGFRASCLQAPNETSVWTKFCEIEIVRTSTNFIETILGTSSYEGPVPEDAMRFEHHLSQPLHIHNVYKLAREMANMSVKDGKVDNNDMDAKPEISLTRNGGKARKWKSKNKGIVIESSTPLEELGLGHKFAEGPYITLADILLYPCFCLLFSYTEEVHLKQFTPLINDWMKNMIDSQDFSIVIEFLNEVKQYSFSKLSPDVIYTAVPNLEKVSLYKCDPKRTSKKKKMFTKEEDIETALKIVDDFKLDHKLQDIPGKGTLDWKNIPNHANPFGGYLPEERMLRKTQQLENLATVVANHLAKDGDRIVDFCSGGGHLGIVLAYLLPKCTVVLLENKEESVRRARERVVKLGLRNVHFLQSNLDYFIGEFEIGVALHACGVATDLVLDNCVRARASFVVAPCCYGSVHRTDRLRYPRSREFDLAMSVDQYLCLGHAADQTHEGLPLMKARGERCMRAVDSDRARQAESRGYAVRLSRLEPLGCTPKNMLIVGVKNV